MPPLNPPLSPRRSLGELQDTSMVGRTLTALASFSEGIVGRMRDRFVPSFSSAAPGQSQATPTSQDHTDLSDGYLSYLVRAPNIGARSWLRRETVVSAQRTQPEEPDLSSHMTDEATNTMVDQYALNDDGGWDPSRSRASSREIGALESLAESLEEGAYSPTQSSERAQALVESTRRGRLQNRDLEEGGVAYRQTEGRIRRLEERSIQLQLLLGIVGLGIMLIGGGTKLYETVRSPTSTGS